MPDDPRPQTRHDRERVHERAADPAETADRPLEPKSSSQPLHATDEPVAEQPAADPHHALNTPVGEVDPEADSDPYRAATPEDDAEHASGSPGSGQGAEDR
ncbi:MAG: hypothetical protein JOZ07_16260 [Solirubrobacterales bacterium]|nr:hypothetical protein [Solirubrobacterales bacterium]